ncbi:MAG: biotin/lipoyl-binding protein, partial [Planctomycetota bacterium]
MSSETNKTPADSPAGSTAPAPAEAGSAPEGPVREDAPPPAQTKKRSRGPYWIALAIFAVVGGYYSWRYIQFSMTHETTDDAAIDAHILYVSARIAGHVDKVYVDDNQWVEAGQKLATLDARDQTAQVDAAQAALGAAQSAEDAAQADLNLTRVRAAAAHEAAVAALATAHS